MAGQLLVYTEHSKLGRFKLIWGDSVEKSRTAKIINGSLLHICVLKADCGQIFLITLSLPFSVKISRYFLLTVFSRLQNVIPIYSSRISIQSFIFLFSIKNKYRKEFLKVHYEFFYFSGWIEQEFENLYWKSPTSNQYFHMSRTLIVTLCQKRLESILFWIFFV